MPKKAKLGKSRRDKAYWAAKEIGYRYIKTFQFRVPDPLVPWVFYRPDPGPATKIIGKNITILMYELFSLIFFGQK